MPVVVLAGIALLVIHKFKYLSYMITNNLSDDLDVEKERRALAVRSNVLTRSFALTLKKCQSDPIQNVL